MQLKDYYKTLNISPTAGVDEIRKSFRRLALQYHPDKNNNDQYKEAFFKEVREAYEVLSDPKSREEYNYKRWYTRTLGRQYKEEPITPVAVLAEVKKLSDYVFSVNDLQIDHDVLSKRIRELLSDNRVDILLQFGDLPTNRKIVRTVLECMRPLPFRYIEPITVILARIAVMDNEMLYELKTYSRNRSVTHHWDKYIPYLVIITTIIICLLMYWYAS
jgi:hypothetical protein